MALKKRYLVISLVIIILIITTVVILNNRREYIDVSQMVSVSISTEFPENYIDHNRGKIMVEIPEVYELLNIVIALSNIDEEYSSLTNKKTTYYQSVLEHFAEYRDHPIVNQIKTANNELGYSHVRNLFTYDFAGNSIVHGGIYASQYIEERFARYIEQLEDFAKISEFRQFYEDHQDYYNQQIAIFKKTVPIKQMWDWLEVNFPIEHDSYKVVMSPLTGGSHNTFNYRDQKSNYSEIVMFLSTPTIFNIGPDSTDKALEGLMSRLLFTEIDHNYVNPTTNAPENIMDVVRAFSNKEKWNKGSGYGRPALTFNEYMTWGVFLLYANEKYEGEVLEKIKNNTVATMNYRGFVHFQQFYEQLLELYLNQADEKTVAELYPDIIKWSKRFIPRAS